MSAARWARLADCGLRFAPRSSHSHHKGSCGRVAIIGGSEDYSGAPYLAAMSALRCGADLAFVFCPPSVAPVIKSYSPDLVVRGLLCEERLPELLAALESCHSVVMGPGMGTGQATQAMFSTILGAALNHPRRVPVVLDACAVKMFAAMAQHQQRQGMRNEEAEGEMAKLRSPLLLADRRVILTPNENEYRLLAAAAGAADGVDGVGAALLWDADRVATQLGVTILRKGARDSVGIPGIGGEASELDEGAAAVNWNEMLLVHATEGAPRRAGGQGDLLCGAVGAFSAFASISKSSLPSNWEAAICAAASCVVKTASRRVYDRPGMSTYIASDVLSAIGCAREELLAQTNPE